MNETVRADRRAVSDVRQWVRPGPAPLAMSIRPTITAATAVAARIVRNQYRRFPRSTKSFGFLVGAGLADPDGTLDLGREASKSRGEPPGLLTRRWGEIQGKID